MEWEFECLDIDKSAWESFIKACQNGKQTLLELKLYS